MGTGGRVKGGERGRVLVGKRRKGYGKGVRVKGRKWGKH